MKSTRMGISFCLILLLCLVSNALSQIPQFSPDDTLYYGRIPEGKVGVRNVSIYNLGTTSLNISDFRVEGADAASFSILEDPGTVSLGLLQKIILEVQFQPVSEGAFSAKFIIESNAGSSPDEIVLAGYGTRLDAGFIAFERIFGHTKNDGAGSVRVTSDGGYILGGSTRQVEREYGDARLIKLDAYGQIEWSEIYGIEDWSENFGETIPTDDGGYIAVGNSAHSDKYYPPDIMVVKFDATGTVEWDNSYGDKENDEASFVIQTDDGGYLISGSYQHDTEQRQDTDAWLIKLNADGSLDWEKKYGGSYGEGAGRVFQTEDNGYIFSGSTMSSGAGMWDAWLVKLDADGNVEWDKTYGGSDWDSGGGLVLTNDGGYLVAGWTANFGVQARDVYIVKTDSAGTQQWYKTFGDAHKDHTGDVIQTSDGGYLIVGSLENTYFSQAWRADGYIIKTNSSGNEVWSKTYGGFTDDGFGCVREVGDGGFIISGSTNSYYNESEIYLLKIWENGEVTSVSQGSGMTPDSYLLSQNYPNPFNNQTMIQYRIPERAYVRLEILNLLGQRIQMLVDEYQPAGNYSAAWTPSDLTSGLYFYHLSAGDFNETRRMLLLK